MNANDRKINMKSLWLLRFRFEVEESKVQDFSQKYGILVCIVSRWECQVIVNRVCPGATFFLTDELSCISNSIWDIIFNSIEFTLTHVVSDGEIFDIIVLKMECFIRGLCDSSKESTITILIDDDLAYVITTNSA